MSFNSIKVRLRQLIEKGMDMGILFQFHKGTIKTQPLDRRALSLYSFNSIKVRLRLDDDIMNVAPISFQFHKGTTKTLSKDQFTKIFSKFQFHKGTIKT